MSGIDSFSASESVNQGSSAESFRLFQERMKAASAQIQALRKGESKQKKKEDDLAKILTDFIKSSKDDQLIEYISKLLAINLPAIFVISLVFINFPELQEKTGLKLLEFSRAAQAGVVESQTLPDLYHQNRALPLEIKIALDSWIQEISAAVHSNPAKILDHALRLDQKVKPEIVDLATYSLTTYLFSKDLLVPADANYQFMQICLQGIFSDLIQKQPHLLE
jgi:hypothetical protein